MTKSYHGVQINRLIRHIEKTKGSTDVTSLTNLEELIKAALTNTRKKLPNEEMFFTFLFDNGMGHFVKNRSKIDLYYKDRLTLIRFSKYPAITSKSSLFNFGLKIHVHVAKI